MHYELVAISGAIEGSHYPVKEGEALLLGRTTRGIHVPDPAVSVQHAQVEIVPGGIRVTDLGSASGTFVGDKPVPASGGVVVPAGSVIRVGETKFQVVKRRNPLLVRAGLLGGATLVSVGALVGIMVLSASMEEGGVRLVWSQPFHLPNGQVVDQVDVPLEMLRANNLDPTALGIRRVRDSNQDGVDEVWLVSPTREVVFTFGAGGAWERIGVLPLACTDRSSKFDKATQGEWPQLRCTGETWTFRDGAYRPIAHDGVVVWVDPRTKVPPRDPKAKAPPPAPPPGPYTGQLAPVRVNIVHPERFSAFFEARGVTEPVQYLVCEGAIPGTPALARTESGDLVRLRIGCLADLLFDGQKPGEPMMVAFTARGRDALLRDLQLTWGLDAEGSWMAPDRRALLDGYRADPGMTVGASRLDVASEPVATPFVLGSEGDPLPAQAWFDETGTTPAQREVARLVGPGTVSLDPPGCAIVDVSTVDWRCRWSKGCWSSSTFATVTERGCGEPRVLGTLSFVPGTFDISASPPVRVQVDVRDVSDGQVVIGALVGVGAVE